MRPAPQLALRPLNANVSIVDQAYTALKEAIIEIIEVCAALESMAARLATINASDERISGVDLAIPSPPRQTRCAEGDHRDGA
jgi:DNA-binding GntR family transcriptional regulator